MLYQKVIFLINDMKGHTVRFIQTFGAVLDNRSERGIVCNDVTPTNQRQASVISDKENSEKLVSESLVVLCLLTSKLLKPPLPKDEAI